MQLDVWLRFVAAKRYLPNYSGACCAELTLLPLTTTSINLVMHSTRTWTAVLAVVLLVSGCRMYGGYGSERAIHNQMERIVERFEEDLTRAQADLRALEAAAPGHPTLNVLTAQYARLISAHEAVLDEQRQVVAGLSAESTYRSLHRSYGSLISEQQLIRQQYQGVLRYVYEAYGDEASVRAERPYASIPPYYARVAGENALTVNAVVTRVQSTPAPRPGFHIMMPEVPSEPVSHEEGGH